MKQFLKDLRFAVKDAWQSRGRQVRVKSNLAKTLRESTHVRGAHGGLSRAGTEAQQKIAADGADDYAKSFEHDD